MNLRRLLVVFLLIGSLYAADEKLAGRICDRNGVVLVRVNRLPDGAGLFLTYPLGAFAAQMLRDLEPRLVPRHGETVYLTIDASVQMAAEQALRSVHRGTVVLMSPETGDILAMASVPSFAPSRGGFSELEKDPTAPLVNRAVKAYAPGATFLPITLLAGLSAGLKDFSHDCTGSRQFGDKVMRCWIANKEGGHGPQTLSDGMKNSCSTFFYECAIAAGPEELEDTASALGLGRVTGIPLQHEASGVVAGPASLAKISPN
jgi:penicillin-binding protein 2